jgi:hypothetical protein
VKSGYARRGKCGDEKALTAVAMHMLAYVGAPLLQKRRHQGLCAESIDISETRPSAGIEIKEFFVPV